jgi:hypothetical protein
MQDATPRRFHAIGSNIAALVSVIGIGLQAILCFIVAEGPIGSFHLGLFGAASVAYLIGLLLALRTSLWQASLIIAVLSLLLDAATLYRVFIAPTSSTEALSLLVMPLIKVLIIVPVALIAGIILKKVFQKLA